MKTIIFITTVLFTFASNTFGQSILNYQAGTSVVVQPGADICADSVIINGTFSGGGTICGLQSSLDLTAFIEGFYNPSSNTMISDTITVYLRNATTPYAKIDSAKSVLSPTGQATFIFLNTVNGTNYYIVIKHRNSIETWSNTVVAFASGTLTYDFTPAANKAYGHNQVQVDNSPLKFAIYCGDVNQDDVIDITDNQLVDNDAFNFVLGYVPTDLNGDNTVDLSDAAIADNNAFNFVSVMRPLFVSEKISDIDVQ